MSAIILIVLVILGLPLFLFVWLIRKAFEHDSAVEQLREEVYKLKAKIQDLKSDVPAPTPTASAYDVYLRKPIEPKPEPSHVPPPVVQAPVEPEPAPLPIFQSKPVEAVQPTYSVPPRLEPTMSETVEKPWVESIPKVDWEQFMGIKLFAWLGGVLIFFAVAFFVKYSFENNLIPPSVRVATGYILGVGFLVGGLQLLKRDSPVLAKTLCATGILILYGVTFAAHTFYHFFGDPGTLIVFSLMVLITTTAFLLAVRLDAQVVAILGLVGGFLTPLLLSTGKDNPVGLFGYIAILDIGLLLVALRTGWIHLFFMGAVGTALMQCGWTVRFFDVPKIYTAMTVYLVFEALFIGAFARFKQSQILNKWASMAAVLMPSVTLAFSFFILSDSAFGKNPGLVFTFVLAADLGLLVLALLEDRLAQVHLFSGTFVFIELCVWTMNYADNSLLYWGLGFYFVFAVLHSIFPLVLKKLRPQIEIHPFGQIFPAVALGIILLWVFNHPAMPWIVWVGIFLIDVLAIVVAILASSVITIGLVLIQTLFAVGCSFFKIPAELTGLPTLLFLLGGFSIFFFAAGLISSKLIQKRLSAGGTDFSTLSLDWQNHIPTLSSVLPFLLLILVTLQLPIVNPSPILGLALLLLVLLLAVSRYAKLEWLTAVGLASVLALEYVWHGQYLLKFSSPWVPMEWYLLFSALFIVYPFVFKRDLQSKLIPWIVSSLALPAHFPLIYSVIKHSYPGLSPYMGAIPAVGIIPPLLALILVIRHFDPESNLKEAVMAWFGGVTLFFVTLIFPIQFSAHWLTIAWALEGVALLWLYHRLPQWGLRVAGVGLLITTFARFLISGAVWNYLPVTENRIFNLYLYTYGVVTICLFVGARLLHPPREKVGDLNVMGLLYSLGTILAFVLMNVEIASFFTNGYSRPFEFSDNFAREMTCSIAWALFAMALLVAGILKSVRQCRYVSIVLLSVTVLKLLLHDFSHLDQLHRIGATVGVAIVLLIASFLFQKYFNLTKNTHEKAA